MKLLLLYLHILSNTCDDTLTTARQISAPLVKVDRTKHLATGVECSKQTVNNWCMMILSSNNSLVQNDLTKQLVNCV